MKKINIAFITNSLGFGGAEKMLTFVANSLASRGHSVSIINLNAVPEYVNEHRRTVNDIIPVYELEQGSRATTVDKLRFILRSARNGKADVLAAFTGFPNMYAKIVGVLLGIPSIMSERGDPMRTSPGTLKAKLCRAIINRSKGGVFQTEGARAFYGKGLQKRGIVIPNPIFINGEIPQISYGEREKTVVSVGRFDNFQKRYDVMLDAFKLFSDKHPEYTLKLYGRGEDEEQIKTWVGQRGLSDKVRFMGLTTQPMQDTCRDGMFLITSDFEGISNALLEAMAVGLPCVSTDHTPGGARLLITDHENGLLAPVGDAKKLAAAMCQFAEQPELAAKCAQRAKAVVTRFSPERIIDLWESYILKVAQR